VVLGALALTALSGRLDRRYPRDVPLGAPTKARVAAH